MGIMTLTSAADTTSKLDSSYMDDTANSQSVLLAETNYRNDGYIGSKATVTTSANDDLEVCKIMIDNGGVKNALDDSDHSWDMSVSDDERPTNCCALRMERALTFVDAFYSQNKDIIKKVVMMLLLAVYCGYFVWAIVLDFKRALALVVITALTVACLFYSLIRDKFGSKIYMKYFEPVIEGINSKWYIIKWLVAVVLLGGLVTFLALEVNPRQLVSLVGFAMFLMVLYIFSAHPTRVRWRPVIWGFGLQFLLAVFILRTSAGYAVFKFLGDEVQKFLAYTDYGSEFVFGKQFKAHFFAFAVLPVVVFFSCVIATLYHIGVMQAVIGKIAWVMQITLGTAATESLTAAGNIFVGQTEAPILVRPFIKDMTLSELHAMMTGGFATIAGGVLAAYIMFGVPPEHLLCASVMNAPVALAVSKLFYPETESSKSRKNGNITMEDEGRARNILQAASGGASSSIKLVANIAANLIAFLALLAFINAVLSWLGSLVDYPELSFQLICSYIFMPVAYLMGVEWQDAGIVGELLGMKLFLNEFVAYEELGKYIKNRHNCDYPQISIRSEVICTYALCGFANLSSIGIQLGGIGPMAPERKGDLAKLAVRALFAGYVVCLISASVAGVLTLEQPFTDCLVNSTLFNSTVNTTIPSLTPVYNLTVFNATLSN